jgi:hypothetical protein
MAWTSEACAAPDSPLVVRLVELEVDLEHAEDARLAPTRRQLHNIFDGMLLERKVKYISGLFCGQL